MVDIFFATGKHEVGHSGEFVDGGGDGPAFVHAGARRQAADLCTGIGLARGPVLIGTAAAAGRAACACFGTAVTRAQALAWTCAQGKRPFLADAGIDAAPLPGQPGSDRSA